uniref:Uncharacterized protein n=1 Tax=Lepeophtheirus salmonis TaxID=72036 RepID=A0A0K2SX75_LEPSM
MFLIALWTKGIGQSCFLVILQIQFDLLDKALLPLQRFRLADVIVVVPVDAQLLRLCEWKFVDHVQVSFYHLFIILILLKFYC